MNAIDCGGAKVYRRMDLIKEVVHGRWSMHNASTALPSPFLLISFSFNSLCQYCAYLLVDPPYVVHQHNLPFIHQCSPTLLLFLILNFSILQLSEESTDVALHIELNLVDKELHDVLMDKREYVEVMHLHGYTTILWRDNARKALSQRQVSACSTHLYSIFSYLSNTLSYKLSSIAKKFYLQGKCILTSDLILLFSLYCILHGLVLNSGHPCCQRGHRRNAGIYVGR